MVSRWDKFRDHKNAKRRIMHTLPLERHIKNAMRRALISWRRGLYATPQAVSLIPPVGLPRTNVRGAAVTFYCPLQLTNANGFLVRWIPSLKRNNPSFVAIFYANTIIACPNTYVVQGHAQALAIPSPLSVCAYCSTVVFMEQECACGAPQFFLPDVSPMY